MDPANSRPLLPGEPHRSLSPVPNDVSRGDVEQDPLRLALSLGGDNACIRSIDFLACSIVPNGEGCEYAEAWSDCSRPPSELTDGKWPPDSPTDDVDGFLSSGTSSPSRARPTGRRTAELGDLESSLHAVFGGPQHRQTAGKTDGSSNTSRNSSREGVAAAAATYRRGQPWQLRRNNPEDTGIPVVWRGEGAHTGHARPGRRSVCCSVLELQFIHADDSVAIPQRRSSDPGILGFIYADTAGASGKGRGKEESADGETEAQEYTCKLIGGTEFQYWLTSEHPAFIEGLDVLLDVLPESTIHLVQCPNLILPGFRYSTLVCGRLQCLLGKPILGTVPRAAHLPKHREIIGFLAFLGFDGRNYTMHPAPAELGYAPDPRRNLPGLTYAGLDMSWYPRWAFYLMVCRQR
jgi:hypothetical protein